MAFCDFFSAEECQHLLEITLQLFILTLSARRGVFQKSYDVCIKELRDMWKGFNSYVFQIL